MGSFNLI